MKSSIFFYFLNINDFIFFSEKNVDLSLTGPQMPNLRNKSLKYLFLQSESDLKKSSIIHK